MLRRLLRLCTDCVRAYGRHDVARCAAALSYFTVLTLFPLLMCASSLVGTLRLSLEAVLEEVGGLLPAPALSAILDYLAYAGDDPSPALLPACVATVLMCASAALRTLLSTMDDLFAAADRPGPWRTILSFVLSALFLPTMYLSAAVVLTGEWFFRMLEGVLPGRLLPLSLLSRLWQGVRYLLLFLLVFLLVAAVYRLGIPRTRVSRRGLWGFSALTALAMAGCSAVFSRMIELSARYTLVYGSLASVIILLVWLYFCGNILLLGAVVCSVWETAC